MRVERVDYEVGNRLWLSCEKLMYTSVTCSYDSLCSWTISRSKLLLYNFCTGIYKFSLDVFNNSAR